MSEITSTPHCFSLPNIIQTQYSGFHFTEKPRNCKGQWLRAWMYCTAETARPIRQV